MGNLSAYEQLVERNEIPRKRTVFNIRLDEMHECNDWEDTYNTMVGYQKKRD